MFATIRKAKVLVPFFNKRLGDYAQLARLDLLTFRNEMIASIVGAAVGAAALLMLLCFVCIALIITEWDTPNRIRTVWMIAGAWGIIFAACACAGKFMTKCTSAFDNIGSEIALDLEAARNRTEVSGE